MTSIRAVQTIRTVQHVRAAQGAVQGARPLLSSNKLWNLMRSDAAGKFTNETRCCKTRSTTARPCLLSINTPCDHISASGTSSTHASALAKGLGTLRNRVLQRCCTTVLHYPSVRTTAHTHLILCRWTRQINGRHIAYSSQRRQPAGHRRHRRPDTDCPSTHQKIDRTVIRSP